MPQPLGDRLHLAAGRFRTLAETHDATAQTAEEALACPTAPARRRADPHP
ncbi:hypothetical protein [Streptomyces parvus]